MGCGGSKKDSVIEPIPMQREKSSSDLDKNTVQDTITPSNSPQKDFKIKRNQELLDDNIHEISDHTLFPNDFLNLSYLDEINHKELIVDQSPQLKPFQFSEPATSIFETTDKFNARNDSRSSSMLKNLMLKFRQDELNTSTLVDDYESIVFSQNQTPIYTNIDADYCIARVWQGFVQVFSTKFKKIFKRYDPKFSMNARAIVKNDGQIMITGGNNSPKLALEIDHLAINVKVLSDMITGRENHAMAYSGSRIYVIGGFCRKTLKECEYYENGKWNSMPSLNTPRQNHSAIENIGMLYVFGGKLENSIEMWNGNRWIQLDIALPQQITRLGVANFSEDELLLAGGSIGPPCKTAWKLNLITGEMGKLPDLPAADIFSNSGLMIGSKVYLLGSSAGYIFNKENYKWNKVDQVLINKIVF